MERLSDTVIEIVNELHRERLDYDSEYFPLMDAINRLAAYEDTGLEPQTISEILNSVSEWYDAHKEGRLLVLPCKVGDMLYVIIDGKIYEGEVYHISYSDYYGKVTATAWTKGGVGGNLEDFGKTAFLTREAAEAKLKEMNGDG